MDFDLAVDILKKLINHEEAEIPDWDFKIHGRSSNWIKVKPTDIVFFEGILAFNDKVCEEMSVRGFVLMLRINLSSFEWVLVLKEGLMA